MSDIDILIRGGTVVDGTGEPPRQADVAIRGDEIVAVGDVSGGAAEVVDARGLLVTPGWVDIHTHYDGQMTWESRVVPSSRLGATTIVAGNCGVGFAPARPQDHNTLIRLMEGVEDIPGAALHEGLPWTWETFPQFLDAVDAIPHDIDVAVHIPHGALRVYVMGERGAKREPATAAEMAQMRAIVRDAIKAGAIGFSTTRAMIHRTADGDFTPTLDAAREELMAIAAGIREAGRGVMQVASDFRDLDGEFELLCDLSKASGQMLSFAIGQSNDRPNMWRELLERLEQTHRPGVQLRAQVAGRAIGILLGLQGSVNPFISRPSFRAIEHLPLAEKVRRMRDDEFRSRLLAETSEPGHPFVNAVAAAYDRMFTLGDPPNYEPDPDDSIGAQARRLGVHPDVLVYDALLNDDGHAFLYCPIGNYTEGSLDNVRTMFLSPRTLPGLSDGGAHVGAICDVSLPTFMLTHWCRDRSRGAQLDLASVIRSQTKDTAEAVGMWDRGVLKPGYLADINLIDFKALQLTPPHMSYDLPTGARRLMQEAHGYVGVIKSGRFIYREGEPTGALPGRLVRDHAARPTDSARRG